MADQRESTFWSTYVRRALSRFGCVERVENLLGSGFPDCVFTLRVGERHHDGFLELKALPGWPAEAGTPVRIHHYTPEQREWHRRWAAARGRIFVAVMVEGTAVGYTADLSPVGRRTPNEFFLFHGGWAAEYLGDVPRDTWYAMAAWHGTTFDARQVVSALLA